MTLSAFSNGQVDSHITGLSLSGGSIAVSVVSALNEATSTAEMKLGGSLKGSLNVNSDVKGTTKSGMTTGSGNIIGIRVNVANAYGRTNSFIDVDIAKASTGKMSITANNTGSDDVTNKQDNIITISGVSIAVVRGAAHSQDRYETKVKLAGGDYDAENVKLNTDYNVSAVSEVTPSKCGVEIEGLGTGENRAITRNTAVALTELTLDNARLLTKDVTVLTSGKADVKAVVKPAEFTLSGVKVGANKTISDLSMQQSSGIKLNNAAIKATGAVDVSSIVKKADSRAVVSTSGVAKDKDNVIKLGAVVGDINLADSWEKISSTAAIVGAAGDNRLNAASLNIQAGNSDGVTTTSQAVTNGANTAGVITVGNLDGAAYSADKYIAQIEGVSAEITGEAKMKAQTNTQADGEGTMPGSWSVVDVGVSKIKASVGTSGSRETAKVIIGNNTTLTADTVSLDALNQGNAYANFVKGVSAALAKVGTSCQPTDSWYDTGVIVNNGAKLTAQKEIIEDQWKEDEKLQGKYSMNITSETRANATSKMKASQYGVALNVNVMKGMNTIKDENNIDIGDNAELRAKGSIHIKGSSSSEAEAETVLDGGGIVDGSAGEASNTIDRVVRVNIRDGAKVTSETGTLNIISISGDGDHIVTNSEVDNDGGLTIGESNANTTVTYQNQILVGEETELVSYADMNLLATATSRRADGGEAIAAKSKVKTRGFVLVPKATTETTLNYTTYISINRDGQSRSQLNTNGMELNNGNGADINIIATNSGMNAASRSGTDPAGFGGGSKSVTKVDARLYNNIWVDQTNLMSAGNVKLKANNGEGSKKAILLIHAYAELYSATGWVASDVFLHGSPYNQIKSNNVQNVRFVTRNKPLHEAPSPLHSTDIRFSNTVGKKGLINDTSEKESVWDKSADYRCDFCAVGSSRAIDTITEVQRSHSQVDDAAEGVVSKGVSGMSYGAFALPAASNSNAASALKPVDAIYRVDVPVNLTRNMTVSEIGRYCVGRNSTGNDVYVLPNAARLYMNSHRKPDYVTENINNAVVGEAMIPSVTVALALSEEAAKNPVVAFENIGVLDFATGELELPECKDYMLYLDELSSRWLLGELKSGGLKAPELSRGVQGGSIPGKQWKVSGMRNDWRLYWLGDSPKTAKNPDQKLIGLLVNEKTDEVDAFRTTANMLARGKAPVDVSLLFFLDGQRPCVAFYDTLKGTRSLVRIQNRTLRVFLRGFRVFDIANPVYSIRNHLFTMDDMRNSPVSMFDGWYTASFDGNVFESRYLRIEGIEEGTLKTTTKKGQYIWLEQIAQIGKDVA